MDGSGRVLGTRRRNLKMGESLGFIKEAREVKVFAVCKPTTSPASCNAVYAWHSQYTIHYGKAIGVRLDNGTGLKAIFGLSNTI